MFLESLLHLQLKAQGIHIVKMVISQINLLICLVNDILDLKKIEEDKYTKKMEIFSPFKTFDFIANMFTSQVEILH